GQPTRRRDDRERARAHAQLGTLAALVEQGADRDERIGARRVRIGTAWSEHDERFGEQRHQSVGVPRAVDRLIDLADEALGLLLGLALVDGRLLDRGVSTTAATATRSERERC